MQVAHFKQRSRSVSLHHKNIQTLTTEVFKAVNNICPPIMKNFFFFQGKQIQHEKIPRNETAKSKNCPIRSRSSSLSRSSTMVSCPADLKSLLNVNLFKSKIKHWEGTECPCKLCKTYLRTIGYV